ncbi:MAG: hypothetical protein KF774_17830 [Planctomyces sp.]|nr:hypothetical protein [Planctomyces sp.]
MSKRKTPIPEAGVCVDALVVHVLDGDTLRVRVTREFDVRILDCWAPETRSSIPEERAKGAAAAERVRELVGGRSVRVFVPNGDETRLFDQLTFSRVLGHVYVDGQSLADRLYAEGLSARTKDEQRELFGPGRYSG